MPVHITTASIISDAQNTGEEYHSGGIHIATTVSTNGSRSAAMAVNIITDLLLMLSLLRPRGGAAAHFLKLSLSATARLKMGCSGVESLSRQK